MRYRHCHHRGRLAECAVDVKRCCECLSSQTAMPATVCINTPSIAGSQIEGSQESVHPMIVPQCCEFADSPTSTSTSTHVP